MKRFAIPLGVVVFVTILVIFTLRMSQSAVDSIIGVAIGAFGMSPAIGAYFYYKGVQRGIDQCMYISSMKNTQIVQHVPQIVPQITNYMPPVETPISYTSGTNAKIRRIE